MPQQERHDPFINQPSDECLYCLASHLRPLLQSPPALYLNKYHLVRVGPTRIWSCFVLLTGELHA